MSESEPAVPVRHRSTWFVVLGVLVSAGLGAGSGWILSRGVVRWNPSLSLAAALVSVLAALVWIANRLWLGVLERRGRPSTFWRRARLHVVALVSFLIAIPVPPALHLWFVVRGDVDDRRATAVGHVDDASRSNSTRVAEVWTVPSDREEAERQLAALLRRAEAEGLGVAIGGARHSMGGHTIAADGVVIDMLPFDDVELDAERNVLRVGAGARWADILPYLDRHGRSVAVMQSNNSFSVGGSISVNCHGWQYGRLPIASTVRSLRLMQADGTIVRCSREENAELFSLVLGGYGLFGVVLDVELRVVPNVAYRSRRMLVPADRALAALDDTVGGASPGMVYARLNIDPSRLFADVVLTVYTEDEGAPIPPLRAPGTSALRRAVFRGSARSDYGKRLRWFAETRLQPLIAPAVVSRNGLLNEGVEVFESRSNDHTDILHEYFVPRHRIGGFVDATRRIVTRHGGDLLNVTVRSVEADEDTFLRYADGHVFSLVMLFTQPRTVDGERRMEAMSVELTEAAIRHDGRHYLPYRLHATVEQFERAYPMARRFFERKRHHDPGELFRNAFYHRYGHGAE